MILDGAKQMKRSLYFWGAALLIFLFSAVLARYGAWVQDTEYYLWQISLIGREKTLVLQPGTWVLTKVLWAISFGSLYCLRIWMLAISSTLLLFFFVKGTARTSRDAGITLGALFLLGVLFIYITDSAYWVINCAALLAFFSIRYIINQQRSARWPLGVLCGLLVIIRPPSGWICAVLAITLFLTNTTSREEMKRAFIDICIIATLAIAFVLLFTTWYAGSPQAFLSMMQEKAASMPPRYTLTSLLDTYKRLLFTWAYLPFAVTLALGWAFRHFKRTRSYIFFIVASVFFLHCFSRTVRLTPELQALGVATGMVYFALLCILFFWEPPRPSRKNTILFTFLCIMSIGVTLGSDSWPSRDICRPLLILTPLFFYFIDFSKEGKAKTQLICLVFLLTLVAILPYRRSHSYREGKDFRLFSTKAVPVNTTGYGGILTGKQNSEWYLLRENLITALNENGYQIASIGAFGCVLDYVCMQKGITTVSSAEFWRLPKEKQTKAHLIEIVKKSPKGVGIFICYRKPSCRWSERGWSKAGKWPQDYLPIEKLLSPYGYRVVLAYEDDNQSYVTLLLPEAALKDEALQQFHFQRAFVNNKPAKKTRLK